MLPFDLACSDFFLNIILTCLGGLLHPRDEAAESVGPLSSSSCLLPRRTHSTDTNPFTLLRLDQSGYFPGHAQ